MMCYSYCLVELIRLTGAISYKLFNNYGILLDDVVSMKESVFFFFLQNKIYIFILIYFYDIFK